MATIALTLLPLVPLLGWGLIVAWSPSSSEGELLLHVHIPLLARAKMLSLPMLLGLIVFAITPVFGDIHWRALLFLLIAFTIMVAIPIRYTLTTMGIRTGRGRFRRWTEFAGVRRSASGVTLQGGPRSSSYPIFLSGNREDDEFVLTLKNLVLDSYKGKATERNRLRGGTPVT